MIYNGKAIDYIRRDRRVLNASKLRLRSACRKASAPERIPLSPPKKLIRTPGLVFLYQIRLSDLIIIWAKRIIIRAEGELKQILIEFEL